MDFIHQIFSKKCLGIDIVAFSIKIVELSAFGKKRKLENYFQFNLKDSKLKIFDPESLGLLSKETAEVLNAIFKKEEIKEKRAAFSLPDFSIFSTSFYLPPMTREEVPQAIEFKARHYIPIPLSEVAFDWQIIEKKEMPPEVEFKILLMAIPNKVLWNYQKMVNLTVLELKGLEAEVFALIRSSVPEELSNKIVILVDIGWQSTTINIVEKKTLKESYSFDISSNSFTQKLSTELKISLKEAERLKLEYGLDPHNKEVNKVLIREINSLALEIERVSEKFFQQENKKIEGIILAGGTANLFGLKEYLGAKLKKTIYLANPFNKVSFPSILKNRLKELGPSFGVAIGAALMGLET